MYSNPFAVLALAAQRTSTIRLGTGLAVAGLRLAPVVANGIATLSLEPDEARFVIPEIIRNFCVAGQPDEIIQRLHELEADGLTGVNFALPTDTTRELVEQFAKRVLNPDLDG